jgi:hypothetical protein
VTEHSKGRVWAIDPVSETLNGAEFGVQVGESEYLCKTKRKHSNDNRNGLVKDKMIVLSWGVYYNNGAEG